MAQHLSIRIPWKDNGYNGFVCDKPCYNNSCLRLKNIAEKRDDELEMKLAGCSMSGHEMELPCISEGGAFMSNVSHTRTANHPYKKNNSKTHNHFLETELVYPPFSLPARPFGWTMLCKGNSRDNIDSLSKMYNIDYDPNREPDLDFDTNWIQNARNQRAIFEKFYKNVEPHKSFVIPYVKQVPFIEDAKRVVIGIGFVTSVMSPPEYNHTNDGELRSILWETMIGHSIRDNRKDGFLLPYREMMAYAKEHPDFDMHSVTVFAEDDYFDEFSFATEHLSYDAVISVLLQTIKALGIIKQCIPGNWDECIVWANARLTEVWKDRGGFPGAGIMLYAMGFKYGILIAEEVKASLTDNDSFIDKLELAIVEPSKYLSLDIVIGNTERKAFVSLQRERKSLFWLLSRFSLTLIQACALFNRGYNDIDYKGNIRFKKINLDCSDADIRANPYIVYEKTRLLESELQIPFRNVDMAVFPPQEMRQQYPLLEPSLISADNDERRIRAIAVSVLERQTDNGHTVYPQTQLIADINELPLDPACSVSGDILNSLTKFFSNEFVLIEMKNSGIAYQLARIQAYDDVIRQSVNKRVNSTNRHQISEDWDKIVNDAFKESKLTDSEKRARQEKAAVLKKLAESRLSVLIGGAGTGKTTLLALLCKSPKIQEGGVLLLAPTGKARVRMSQAMQKQNVKFAAKTVAQFLIQNRRFDFATMRYQLSDADAKDVPNTVIIDECSMLTEEMFGALMQALRKNAQRIIFVGDPNQLPPIGAGRPFVDLVNHLRKDIPTFPRVGKSYGELTVTCRQQNEDGTERLDTMFAEWYADTDAELDSEIFTKLQANCCEKNITFKMWKTTEELEQLLLETVAEEAGMENLNDFDNFNISLGGTISGDYAYFNVGCATSAENWQILAPVKNMPFGVLNINHLIHTKYKEEVITLAKRKLQKKIPPPLGSESIVYGDKVINIRNRKCKAYPDNEKAINYVANGEIGIASGVFGRQIKYLNVELSSQPQYTYSYEKSDFGEESDALLELAYALTVHKAQGSEFGKVILVIAEPCGLLSRELLYTAITRQKDKLVILYNDEAYHLRNYSSKSFSDIARRFTSLFEKPEIVEFQKKFYETGLIHRTAHGELVRSKSEIIIADALFDSNVEYAYEKELDLGEDGIKYPDFTIEDAESGTQFFWEHCGMMTDESYRRRWEYKLAVYEKHDIAVGKNLIVSYDNENGSIDSQAIRNLIKQFLL
ncbi:RecBCD enzyme subunit RecD [termite gut metagenome]|uniref:RecBCD enzyme subunit RecD n=1 Tax=termite gut metagenome TaxID=433724 RepID=A0A5J4R856_9ZZZZ